MTRRVVVTGIGVVCALGDDTETFWRACLAGRSVVEPIPQRWREFADYYSGLWAPLPAIDFAALGFSRVERAQLDPVTMLACTAAERALDAAGVPRELADRRANTFSLPGLDPRRCGVFVGTGVGGAHSFMAAHGHQLLARSRERLASLVDEAGEGVAGRLREVVERMQHARRFNPFAVSMLMPNAPAAYAGIKFSLTGTNETCARACASGTVAIGRAWQAIASGELDGALAGGSEYLDDPHGSIFQGFDLCRTLVRDCEPAHAANRPFDARRSGFLFSQGGAAMLMLEEAGAAERRGRTPIAEVTGYAESFDAHSMMHPSPDGREVESMLRTLLDAAAIGPAEVDYVNAHGTATASNDLCEAAAIGRVFGRGVAVNSTKSLLGHAIGASGAIEAAVTALSLRDQRLHPSLNLDEPIADLDFVTRAEERPLRRAISQSFAFGGHNAAILMARPRAD